MDKGFPPSRGRDHKSLNLSKHSHKISKTTPHRKPSLNAPLNQTHQQTINQSQNQNHLRSESPPLPAQRNQPPVYNINKNEFRDVVQKLTGSPVHPPKPPNTRLHRIRPPPLAHVSNRPLHSLNSAIPVAPLSPLPPLPSIHVAAESPVSAYMRYFHSSVATVDPFSGMLPLHREFETPFLPVAFGSLNSPRSARPVFSAGLVFSPSAGQLGFPQLPISPTVPVPSPRWSGD